MRQDKPKPIAQITLTVYLLEDETFEKNVQMRALGDWPEYRPFRDLLYASLLRAATEIMCRELKRKAKETAAHGE